MGGVTLIEPSSLAAEVRSLGLFTSPLSSVVDGLAFIVWVLLLGVWYYHTYHQLEAVDELYTGYTNIDPFYLMPLYAFSQAHSVHCLRSSLPNIHRPCHRSRLPGTTLCSLPTSPAS